MIPERFAMLFFTTSMPTPRPESAVTCRAVEKPGQEDEVHHLAARQLAHRLARVASPRCTATSRTRSSSMPGPVVLDLDHDVVPLLRGGEPHAARARLPGARARVGRLDGVVDRRCG